MKILSILTFLILTSMAYSAPPGQISTGTVNVSLPVPGAVQISGLQDITFPSYLGSGDVTHSETFCVHARGGADYNMTIMSQNEDAGNFRLESGTEYLPYEVRFSPTTNPETGNVVDSGSVEGPFAGSASRFCGGGDNAGIYVKILEADIDASVPGTYLDVITLTAEAI